jgi:hypothetical protein
MKKMYKLEYKKYLFFLYRKLLEYEFSEYIFECQYLNVVNTETDATFCTKPGAENIRSVTFFVMVSG